MPARATIAPDPAAWTSSTAATGTSPAIADRLAHSRKFALEIAHVYDETPAEPRRNDRTSWGIHQVTLSAAAATNVASDHTALGTTGEYRALSPPPERATRSP